MNSSKKDKLNTTAISMRPKPENIEPSLEDQAYAKMLNKNKKNVNGIRFKDLTEAEEQSEIPYSSEYVRDNTHV